MTLLRVSLLCLAFAVPAVSGDARAEAEKFLVRVDSVQGEVRVQMADSREGGIALRPQAGDILVGPITIITSTGSNIDIRVSGNAVSISANSSVVVEKLPTLLPLLNEHAT